MFVCRAAVVGGVTIGAQIAQAVVPDAREGTAVFAAKCAPRLRGSWAPGRVR